MQDFNEQTHLAEALGRLEGASDPRLREVVAALTRHLFAFVQEVEPSEEEWLQGITFLTEVGQKCDEVRQEYILLSDILGVTMLVDYLNHGRAEGGTESSVLGPFYRAGAPACANGASMARESGGEPVLVAGRVFDSSGRPIAGAKLDVWQTAPNGMYEGQDPAQPPFNLRGVFSTDDDGRYAIRTVKPVSYSIPDDGPAGRLLRALGRHSYRPAHIHFIVSAEGYEPVITQLFTDDDECLDSDAVFGVKESLVIHYERAQDGDGSRVSYDFHLTEAA